MEKEEEPAGRDEVDEKKLEDLAPDISEYVDYSWSNIGIQGPHSIRTDQTVSKF